MVAPFLIILMCFGIQQYPHLVLLTAVGGVFNITMSWAIYYYDRSGLIVLGVIVYVAFVGLMMYFGRYKTASPN
jgi:hypothetical protein